MFNSHRVPFITAIWLITVPLVVAFFGGAGAGTVFDGFARFLSTMFSIFGIASLIVGAALLAWVVWSDWRAGRSGHSGV